MTIKELIEELKKYDENFEVFYEYDGPETLTYLPVEEVFCNETTKLVFLWEKG